MSSEMNIAVIGAGAMGGSFGGLLALHGSPVRLIDADEAHVAAIRQHGLRLEGARGNHQVALEAATAAEPGAAGWADLAMVFVTTRATAAAARTARSVLKPDGAAVTLQNGIGNIEILQEALGKARVFAGSTKCSAALSGPGRPCLTHVGPTTLGELDGSVTPRLEAFAAAMNRAGLPSELSDNIHGVVWDKLVLNAATNAICAVTGLRSGEAVRVPELDRLQTRVIEEVLSVAAAKGVKLGDPDPLPAIKAHCWKKFNKPSMLQHVEAGRPTEIDAINGAILREAEALDIPVPCNEALVALLKGRELAQRRALHEPVNYAELEAEAQNEQRVPAD